MGTGIAGWGAAIALAKAGRRVLIVGRKGVRGESTPAAAGILDPVLEMSPRNPLLALGMKAFREYPGRLRALRRATHLDLGYARTGMLCIAFTKEEEKELKVRMRWQKRAGMPVVWKDRTGLVKIEAALNPRARGGLFYPAVGRIQPKKLLAGLRRYAKELGISVIDHRRGSSVRIEKGRAAGVRIGRAFFQAPVVVNAKGSWAGVGHKRRRRLPIVPARGQILTLKSARLKIRTIVHSLDGAYVVPWGKNQYLLGSTVERVGFKPYTTRRGLQSILARCDQLIPGIRLFKYADTWAGLRPFPKDRLPLIGPTSVSGFYLAAGFYRSGILIGCLAGELLAQGIIRGKMPGLIRPFDPRRFKI